MALDGRLISFLPHTVICLTDSDLYIDSIVCFSEKRMVLFLVSIQQGLWEALGLLVGPKERLGPGSGILCQLVAWGTPRCNPSSGLSCWEF